VVALWRGGGLAAQVPPGEGTFSFPAGSFDSGELQLPVQGDLLNAFKPAGKGVSDRRLAAARLPAPKTC
jgi:hypothetical protein